MKIDIPEYNKNTGLQLCWGDGYMIKVASENNKVVISANREGLISTVQGQTHELTIVIADDSHWVCKGVNSSNRAAHRLLQGFQVVVNLDLLRILSRCNFQHRQGVLVLFHYRPPRI